MDVAMSNGAIFIILLNFIVIIVAVILKSRLNGTHLRFHKTPGHMQQ